MLGEQDAFNQLEKGPGANFALLRQNWRNHPKYESSAQKPELFKKLREIYHVFDPTDNKFREKTRKDAMTQLVSE